MKKFKVCVIETSSTCCVVEAESAEEAEKLLSDRLCDGGAIWSEVTYGLECGYNGYEYKTTEANPDEEVDFTYAELTEEEGK